MTNSNSIGHDPVPGARWDSRHSRGARPDTKSSRIFASLPKGTIVQHVFPTIAAVSIAIASHAALAATPDEDFTARRNAAGVIYSNGFDSASDLSDGSVLPAADGTTQGSLFTSQKTSGASALGFRLRAGVKVANIAGAWSKQLPRTFPAGSDVYFQWRQRFDSNWIAAANGRWNSSYKIVNFHGQSSTCQGSEYTFLAGTGDTRPNWYNNCGDSYPTSATQANNWNPISIGSGDGLLQQGSVHNHPETTPDSGYNCHYQNKFAGNGNGEGCLYLSADIWYTFYVHIRLNSYGGSSGNNIEGYVAWDGGPFRQFIHVTNFSWPSGRDSFINTIRLETYMTELPTRGQGASTDAYTYYDELIVSTQPIALPGASGLYAPPNVRVIK